MIVRNVKMFGAVIVAVFAASTFVGIAAENPQKDRHVILITVDGGAAFYLNDPKAPIPNLRRIASEGTVAEGMKISNPAVTWPNHTTLVTGVAPAKHSVLYNGFISPDKNGLMQRDQNVDKSKLVAVPTVFDLLHKKGFTTAAINWPCTQNPGTLDDNFPDSPISIQVSSPRFIHDLREAKILDSANDTEFLEKNPAERDRIWGDAACYVMEKRRPNFMLLHFLMADGMQHRFGPKTPEVYEALGLIDHHIGKLFETLEKAGLRDSTSVLIVADHGFARFDKQVAASAILRKAGLLQTRDGKARVQIISEGGTAMVYFRSTKTRGEDCKKVIELFANQEGVGQIIGPKEFAKYGYPSPKKNPQMADLVFAAADGYSFSGLEMVNETILPARDGGAGSHGYLSTNPKMNAMFIAAGRGIAKGKKIDLIENIDVAPTIAYLLGEKFSDADGKVLKQILATP